MSSETSTALVILILVMVVVEAAVLSLHWHRHRQGIPPGALLVNLLAGACLMLALLSVLVGHSRLQMLVCLAMAGGFHVLDLRRRWIRT